MSTVNNSKKGIRILLQVTGSIAAFKAVALCSKLVQLGHEVEVVLSLDALKFVGTASFEGLTGRVPHTGLFEEGRMMEHIRLERRADLILLYPASANTIATLAQGRSDSLVGAIFLAHEFKKPYLIAPAMNRAMVNHPAYLANVARLREWGLQIVAGDSGPLACGESGEGRLIEPEALLSVIDEVLAKTLHETLNEKRTSALPSAASASPSRRILVTAGGTREPIDPVRSIHNFSSGETGYRIAEALHHAGHQVTLLQSRHSPFRTGPFNILLFDVTSEFGALFAEELRGHDYDGLVHAAAVADFAVDSVTTEDGQTVADGGKIQSADPLVLRLRPNPKYLQKAREFSRNHAIQIVSFKLTTGPSDDLKLGSYDSEWVIHNELGQVSPTQHSAVIYRRGDHGFKREAEVATKLELISKLTEIFEQERS